MKCAVALAGSNGGCRSEREWSGFMFCGRCTAERKHKISVDTEQRLVLEMMNSCRSVLVRLFDFMIKRMAR